MKINSVLVEGHLTDSLLEETCREIGDVARAGMKSCTLIVKSHGGDMVPAMKFVAAARALPLEFDVKVYNAQSAAAFVALSLRHCAEMKRGTVMGFHRGYLKVEEPDISTSREVPKAMYEALLEYNGELDALLERNGVSDPKLLAQFYGGGWMMLSADECLKYGIVQRLF